MLFSDTKVASFHPEPLHHSGLAQQDDRRFFSCYQGLYPNRTEASNWKL